jgi:EmrB/QacA subfamily drug resistance transporter
VIQGLGAGTILPVGQTMLAQAAGPQRMGRVMSVIGVPMLLGPILGPVIGGAIVDEASWRWIFLVNLPVGAVALVLAQRLLPDAQPRLGQRLDLRGFALLSPGIALFLYGVSEAGSEGGFSSTRTIVATLVGLVLVAGFVWHALAAGKDALLDLTLFARRGFAVAATTNFVLGLALFGALILLPLYYQLVRRESPLDTGLLLAPQGLGAALAMPLAGSLTDRYGARLVVPTGLIVALVGTLGFLLVGEDTSYALLSGALFLIGAGLGSTIMPSMAVAFGSISRDAVPRASSALNAIQRIAGAIGTAVFAIVLQRQISSGVPSLEDGIAELARLGPAAHARIAPALADAFGQTFWIAVALIVVALVPALMLPKPGELATEAAPAEPAERRAA